MSPGLTSASHVDALPAFVPVLNHPSPEPSVISPKPSPSLPELPPAEQSQEFAVMGENHLTEGEAEELEYHSSENEHGLSDEGDGDGAHHHQTSTFQISSPIAVTSVLPTPPLKRVGTDDSKYERRRKSSDSQPELEDSEQDRDMIGRGGGRVTPGEEVEVDITAWRAPHGDSHLVDLAELDHSGDRSRDGEREREQVDEHQHPLRLDINPPSPPPWELIEPPPDNEPAGTDAYSTLRLGVEPSRSKVTLPPHPLVPKSSYYFGPPPVTSAYGSDPIGQIGVHYPREILRIERDYSGGELIQFSLAYPLELEGRITPTKFLETMNAINETLISAHSTRHAFLDNFLAVFSLQISRLFFSSHYDKEMLRLKELIQDINANIYNPRGLNIMWPRKVAFLFLEIEYY